MPTAPPPTQKMNSEKKMDRINLEIDSELREQINRAKVREGRTQRGIFDVALREYITKHHPDIIKPGS